MSNDKKCAVNGKGIGGQAVIEGVMMRGKSMYALAVRGPEGDIKIEKTSLKPRSKILAVPMVRGVVSFVDSLVMGMKVTTRSAELAGLEDIEYDKESKFESWLEKHFGDKLSEYIIYISVFFAIVFCMLLFVALPTKIGEWTLGLVNGNQDLRVMIESVVRILLFVGYILAVSQMNDIKRVFKYHGAEHKTINCFEHNEELTVENVKQHTRLHKRCGTSFIVLVMIISIIVGIVVFRFIPDEISNVFAYRFGIKLLLVPIIAGFSYEIIRWAGKHDNWFVNLVSAPGLALQHITTKEPEDDMIEVAIASLKAVLEEEPEDVDSK